MHTITRRGMLTSIGGAALIGVTGAGAAQSRSQPGGGLWTPDGRHRLTSEIIHDDFRGTSLDDTLWRVRDKDYLSYDSGYITADNAQVRNGALVLSARRMEKPRVFRDGKPRWFSTGYVDTIGKFSQEYGKWGIRAKVPNRKNAEGIWCGFWLRPEDTSLGTEIDIMESYGTRAPDAKTRFDPTGKVEATLHFDQSGRAKANAFTPVAVTDDDWHYYSVVKTPTGVWFYFDGRIYHRVLASDPRFAQAFPPGARFATRLNIQVGNDYWGHPTADTADEHEFIIDYVTVRSLQGYQNISRVV